MSRAPHMTRTRTHGTWPAMPFKAWWRDAALTFRVVVLTREEGSYLPGPSCPPHCPIRNQCRMSGETRKSRNLELPPPKLPQKRRKDTLVASGRPEQLLGTVEKAGVYTHVCGEGKQVCVAKTCFLVPGFDCSLGPSHAHGVCDSGL